MKDKVNFTTQDKVNLVRRVENTKRWGSESLADLEHKIGLDLLDTMIYHQETIEHHLADQSFPVGGDEVLLELLEILKQFTGEINGSGEPIDE